jgi:hypothetical protein
MAHHIWGKRQSNDTKATTAKKIMHSHQLLIYLPDTVKIHHKLILID